MRRPLLALALLAAAGCERLVGAADRAECAADEDCPALYVCDVAAGRCHDPGRDIDLGPVDDADVGPGDAGAPDATPDAGTPGFGPDGDCFGAGAPAIRVPGTDIPRARCTPFVLVWTEPDRDGALRLRYRLGPGEPARTADLELPDPPDLVVRDDVALVPATDGGPANIARVDLGRGETTWVFTSHAPQSQPATDGQLVAYVEAFERGDGLTVRQVHLVDGGGTRTRCVAEGVDRWGPAFTGDRLAFFERPHRGGATDLVLARTDCTVFYRARLEGVPADDARLHADGDDLVWLETDPATRRRAVGRLALGEAAPAPRRAALALAQARNPVDLAVRDGRVALASYSRGGHVLEVHDLEGGRSYPVDSRNNARQPSFSGRFLLWAAQPGTGPWEIRHVALESLR